MNDNVENEVKVVTNDESVTNSISELDDVMSFDSFEEIEDIVTASSKGTIICCF